MAGNMIHLPINVQFPVPPKTPLTPHQRHVPRVPLAPNNQPQRRHQLPVLLPKAENDTMTPVSALAQANARLVHARLRQNHDRLQVQLHAPTPPPPPSAPQPSPSSITNFLSNVVRASASRLNREIHQLNAFCNRLLMEEKAKLVQETAEERRKLTRERDEARAETEKLRILLDRRKRSRAQFEILEEEDSDADELELRYPDSPPPRLLSPFILAAGRNRSGSPDGTHFDLTITGDALPRPAKRRRVSPEPAIPVSEFPESFLRDTHPPYNPHASDGECDMDLETDVESDGELTACSSFSVSKPTSTVVSPPVARPSIQQPIPIAQPRNCRRSSHLGIEHVDIMYWPTEGKLVCRACVLTPSSSPSPAATRSSPAVHAFPVDAPWDILRSHCEKMHPEASADVAGLDRDCLRELRRRLRLPPAPPTRC
ncbi:hypothetical protein MIND_00661300 [Mycena indigotica]|uniref:Uncharacterized protein n=1 Tax=Mycena indigotica TaxID=2126181 RepID=A0A8H6SLF5_9AGAR|nr:uncharacterized protein MIND_00661300 [Mycena indigotica]KAF7300982.1 hypothetical protein MIND_00661300 [Mycena indigotica]